MRQPRHADAPVASIFRPATEWQTIVAEYTRLRSHGSAPGPGRKSGRPAGGERGTGFAARRQDRQRVGSFARFEPGERARNLVGDAAELAARRCGNRRDPAEPVYWGTGNPGTTEPKMRPGAKLTDIQ